MVGLLEALTRAAVTDTENPFAVAAFGDAMLADAELPATLVDLPQVHEASLPELTALAAAAVRANHEAAPTLINTVAERLAGTTHPLVFLDAADVALASPQLLATAGDELAQACWKRYAAARVSADGDGAYNALQAIARLALAGATTELLLRDALLRLRTDDAPGLLERVPRLLGLAVEYWGEGRCREVLQRLLEVREAAADAAFELALAQLRDALTATTLPEAIGGLATARDQFASAERAEEARDDAAAYRIALDAVLSFGASDSTERLTHASDELEAILSRRRAWLTGTHVAPWLAPRAQAEAEWETLITTLRAAAADLNRASWLSPAVAMERVLSAYMASRSITIVPAGKATAVAAIVEPAIEGAFIAREGLLQHLQDLLETRDFSESEAATVLAARIAARQIGTGQSELNGGEDWGKVLAAAPDIARALGPDAAADLVRLTASRLDLIAEINSLVGDTTASWTRSGHPLVDRLLSELITELEACGEFRGDVRTEFTALLTHTLRFIVDRADIGRTSGGRRTAYLFPWPNGNNPWHERELQNDYREWLRDGPLMNAVRVEEADIASGRADVTISLPTSRYTVEIKRELRDASRRNIASSFSGQSVAYAGTSAGLGMLLVLDLTSNPAGIAQVRESVWCERVPIPNADDRFLIVGVVHGNRTLPSEVVTVQAS